MELCSFTCRASVPGCCSSFMALPPALFCPRPSCQVRFPPVLRLSCCLKSSGRALYSTAGLQKLKLDAAAGTTRWAVTTASVSERETQEAQTASGMSAGRKNAQLLTREQKASVERSRVACRWDDVIPFQTIYLLAEAPLTPSLSSREIKCREASLSRQALCVS